MGRLSSWLTIFEGPDGAGKTTAAQAYAKETGARYVHFNSLPRVGKNLGRFYVEAMLPALLGYQDVVLDRCWLSERPYGRAFREGMDRLTLDDRRMLERLAYRCGAVVVRCLPPWETVRANFMRRKELEMLENDKQLRLVYELYETEPTDLPVLDYSYVHSPDLPRLLLESLRRRRHLIDVASAGNIEASTVLVGEAFGHHKDGDSFYQWPFASFSNEGCSRWLTAQLREAKISEDCLFWINADQNLNELRYRAGQTPVMALGERAYNELKKLNISAHKLPHPQAWKRFNHDQPYPLIDLIKDPR